MLHGRCHCRRIEYEFAESAVLNHTLCHCTDCRRHAGAPVVAWVQLPADKVKISGSPRTYHSSEHGRRLFCEACGTNLFYTNAEVLPGKIDVLSATLDEPGRIPVSAQYQTAERIPWMATISDLPHFERWPNV
jgi:hypothetical protein